MSEGTNDISERIAEMAVAAETTNHGSSQTLAAATQLESIADQLTNLLSRFRLPRR